MRPNDSEGRARAVERLEQRKKTALGPDADAARLLTELEIHQVELEMQNEVLLATRAELETNLARYTLLFDFAPVGYVSLSPDGKIHEANLAAARLMGCERLRLIGRPLEKFVDF